LATFEGAGPVPEDRMFTQDFYRYVALGFADGGEQRLSFHSGGGSVFYDDVRKKSYLLSDEQRNRLRMLVAEAEGDL
jgi:hypothetical protein